MYGLEFLSVTERSSLFPELLAVLVHETSAARESFTMESKTRGTRGERIPHWRFAVDVSMTVLP